MNEHQFNKKLIRLQKKLFYFAVRLTRNNEDAQDLLQETSLKALTNRKRFIPDTNFKAWVFTIMKNTFINNYRRSKKIQSVFDGSEDVLDNAHHGHFTSETPEMVRSLDEINKYMNQLDDDFRIPFRMHCDGYKYKEIAKEMGLPIGTVKSRLFFTRKKLKKMLADREDGYNIYSFH